MTDNNEPIQEAAPPSVAPVSIDLKRRMRELLSIPDSQRSDDQWDELIEIEIQLAPGNRVGSAAPRQNESRGQSPRGSGGGGAGGGGGGGNAAGGGNWKRHGPGRKGKPGGGNAGGGGNPSGGNPSGGANAGGGGGGGRKPPQPNPVG